MQRNSSTFGEEGGVGKLRELRRGEKSKEGHKEEDKGKSRGMQGGRAVATFSRPVQSRVPQILSVNRQHPTCTFGTGRP